MLRSETEILNARDKASKRRKEFYTQCLLIAEIMPEEQIVQNKESIESTIKLIKSRIKRYPDSYEYKYELKTLRRKLRCLKYLIIKPKQHYSK